MADPRLDEDYIRALLSVPVTHENTDAIQQGAVQALIDLYDRKVTRDEFLTAGAACLSLYGQCSKLWMLHNVRAVYKDGTLTDQKFLDADKAFCDIIRKQSETVVEIVKRLQLCPTSKDPIN